MGEMQDEGDDIDEGADIDEGEHADIINEQDEGADIGNEQDERAYVAYGPNQPYLAEYPSTKDGNQGRKFCRRWFKEWNWLEYSLKEDKAYCFPCFLFDNYPSRHPSFTEVGFNGWKNVMSKHSGVLFHVGGVMSIHNANVRKWENLRNPSRHIERVISRLSSQEIARNRLRLVATIEVVRLLARQGCSFRGHDESVTSLNGGNFDAVLDAFRGLNNEIKIVTDDGPGNAKYTCPTIQKKIANILANKVRAMIRDEIGDAKFAILVDEALDVSNKEQMAIILRFVNRGGLLRERFFKVVKVTDTCSQTLMNEIVKAFTQYNLQLENIRGQGYDGANNMRGQFNGLQALFQRECPYAYYVHCFAHRLQLSLILCG
ncbi:uncharacterized protein LOC141589643 [Silene latifolia]|uniref:uncharacterized protein LOC141589643 n=1 Tax=Silene latifolia TaxID=37657 RepID=UPI003D78AA43